MAEKRGFLARRWRVLLAALVWIAGGFAAHAAGLLPGAATLVGWNLACVTYLVPTGWTLLRADEAKVRRNACEEDESRAVILLLVLTAAASSFAAVVVAMKEAKDAHVGGALAALSISTIVLSWLVTQTIFAIHYAHKYFGDGDDDGKADKGVKFEGDQPSTYLDFVYIAVCMGATFQVSDFNTTNTSFRNLVTVHALVAFAFNTLVLALGVNIVGNLLGQ